MDPFTSEHLKAIIEDFAHLVVLLVAGVAEAKDCKAHAGERLSSFILFLYLEPFKERTSVIAWITLIVSRNDCDNKRLLGELVFLKVQEVYHLDVINVEH